MNKEREIIMSPTRLTKTADRNANAQYLTRMTPLKMKQVKKLNAEQAQFVRDQVAALPTGELAVIYLRFWEGLCEYEISKTLCLSVAVVRRLISSALERLKEKIIEPTDLITAFEHSECA